jgi:hypothetical protein
MGPFAATTGHYNWKLQKQELYEHEKDNNTFYERIYNV